MVFPFSSLILLQDPSTGFVRKYVRLVIFACFSKKNTPSTGFVFVHADNRRLQSTTAAVSSPNYSCLLMHICIRSVVVDWCGGSVRSDGDTIPVLLEGVLPHHTQRIISRRSNNQRATRRYNCDEYLVMSFLQTPNGKQTETTNIFRHIFLIFSFIFAFYFLYRPRRGVVDNFELAISSRVLFCFSTSCASSFRYFGLESS